MYIQHIYIYIHIHIIYTYYLEHGVRVPVDEPLRVARRDVGAGEEGAVPVELVEEREELVGADDSDLGGEDGAAQHAVARPALPLVAVLTIIIRITIIITTTTITILIIIIIIICSVYYVHIYIYIYI